MANSNYSDFKEIVRDIDDRKILLPDFQRDFVWKDEERQKKIVASVLTKMPIGSILLLTSSADEYCSKIIGRNADLNTSDITGDVDFLLDGQQRITSLFLLLRAIYTKLVATPASERTAEANNFIGKIEPTIWRTNKLTGTVDFKNILLTSRVVNNEGNEFLRSILESG